jgi:hypothetical protein
MNVSSLQKLLKEVASIAQAAGANTKCVGELERVVRSLDLFSAMTIERFSEFLQKAEEYERTGTIALLLTPAKGGSSRKGAKVSNKLTKLTGPEGLQVAVDRYNSFYSRAERRELTDELIDAEISWLDGSLDKPNLIKVAKQIGIKSTLKTKGEALEALKRRALSAMESAINRSFGNT